MGHFSKPEKIYRFQFLPYRLDAYAKRKSDSGIEIVLRDNAVAAFYSVDTFTIVMKWDIIKTLPYPKIQFISIFAHEMVHVLQHIFIYKMDASRMCEEYKTYTGWHKIENPAIKVYAFVNGLFFWRLI